MTLKHEIDISKAVDDVTNKIKSIAGNDEKEQDNLNYNEFRFRIKTVG